MARRINPLYSVTEATPLGFKTWTQRVAELLNANFADIEELIAALEDAVDAITTAQAAAVAAQAAADSAAADAATAQASAEAASASSALSNSYVGGATITASDAGSDVDVVISNHTRYYPQPDGTTTTVSVTGDTLTGQPYSTTLYIYYDDPARAGGAVTYLVTTSSTTAAQTGNRHYVGAVATPAALGAPAPGRPVEPPGSGQYN